VIDTVVKYCLKHTWHVVILAIGVTLIAGFGASKLVFKSDYRVFFSPDNPELKTFEAMQKIYSKSDNVAFVISSKKGKIFTPDAISAVHDLTNEAWQIPYSTRVDSITNFQHTYAENDDLIVEDLVLELDQITEQRLQTVEDIAQAEPLLAGRLISEDSQVTLVNVTIQLPGLDRTVEQPKVIRSVESIANTIRERHPDILVQLTGVVMMDHSFVTASEKDSSFLIPIMFAIVALSILLFLRSISGAIATIIIIASSIAATMGTVGWLGFHLTSPSSAAPIIILTLAVADSIHVLTTFYQEHEHLHNRYNAMLSSIRINFIPVFLTSATTAIGFLSMNFSDSPPFRDLGNFVAIGVFFAFTFSITLLPALIMLLPFKPVKASGWDSRLMKHLSAFVIRQHKTLLLGLSLAMVAIIAFAPANKLNDNFVEYFSEDVPFRQASDFMQEHLTGLASIEVSMDSGVSGGVNDPDFLVTAERFVDWVRAQPQTDHVNTLTDTLKRLNQNMHADNPDYYRLPETREMSAQYLLLYEMSLPYGLDLNNQLNVDKSSTRIVISLKNLTSNEQVNFEHTINEWFAENAPQLQVSLASPSLMFSHIGQRNIESMLKGVVIALFLISILFGFALRSIRYSFYSLLPNLTPALIGFGVWYFISGQVGLALSVVASMTLGIVVDDTIHFLTKYKLAREQRLLKPEAAVEYAFAGVGRALWVTTLVLVLGFIVLAQSTFQINADIGLLTAITLVAALIVDFLFLPPLLLKIDKRSATTQHKGQA